MQRSLLSYKQEFFINMAKIQKIIETGDTVIKKQWWLYDNAVEASEVGLALKGHGLAGAGMHEGYALGVKAEAAMAVAIEAVATYG